MKIKISFWGHENALGYVDPIKPDFDEFKTALCARLRAEWHGAQIELSGESKCCICGKKNWHSFDRGLNSQVYHAKLKEIDDGRNYGLDFMPFYYSGFALEHTFPVYICEKCGYVNFDLGKKIYGITQKKLSEKNFAKKIKVALDNYFYDLTEEKRTYYTKYDLAIDLYEESNKLRFSVKNLFYLGVLYLVLSKNYDFIFSIYKLKIPKEKIINCLNKSLEYFSKYLEYHKDIRIELVCIELLRRLQKYEQAKKKALEMLNKLKKKSIIDDLNSYILQYQIILCDKKNDMSDDIQGALEQFDVHEKFDSKKVDKYIRSLFFNLYVFSKLKTIWVDSKKYCWLNIKQRKRIRELKKGHRELYPWYYEKSNDE